MWKYKATGNFGFFPWTQYYLDAKIKDYSNPLKTVAQTDIRNDDIMKMVDTWRMNVPFI